MKVDGKRRLRGFLPLAVGAFPCAFSFPVDAAKSAPKQAPVAPVPALTVEELVHRSTRAFAAGDWRSAAEHCIALLRDYGDRPEIAQLAKRFQLILLQCHLRLNEWAEALPLFESAQDSLSNAPRPLQGELLLQKAYCERQLLQYDSARESVTASLSMLSATGQRRADATLLLATCMLESNNAEAAGKLVDECLPTLPNQCKEKAVLLGMHAFLKARQPERAYALFSTALARFPDATARIGIQVLLLDAAAAFLENGEAKSALNCLARIHPPERLIALQKQRVTRIQRPLSAVRTPQDSSAGSTVLNNEDAVPLEGEINTLGSGASFSASTRLLIASAYRALNRNHEAALILEEAVSRVPSSDALEVASLEAAKTWFELERWQRVIDSANRFSKAYPASPHAPLMLYLKGCAEQKAGMFGEALATFQSLAKTGTQEVAINAAFMHALTLLLDNRLPEAGQELITFLQKHGKHSFAESAAYFLCVATGQQGPPQPLRSAASAYLESFPNGEHKPVVLLKRAQSLNALKEKAAAVADLQTLLAESPRHACSGEAALLLGDCRLSLGDGEGALNAWRSVPVDLTAAKEEGILKCLKLLFGSGKFEALWECLRELDSVQTDTGRAAEAAVWWWKACSRDGHPEEAAAWALRQIESFGDDPLSKGVDLLITKAWSLAAAYLQEEAWAAKIATLLASADTDGRHTLHSRLVWANACALRSKNAVEASRCFIKAATLHPANATSSAALADGADAMETAGETAKATRLWRDLLKWHPDAPQLDRALFALARLDCAARHNESAWQWVKRFEKTASASTLHPRLLLVKATLQIEQGKPTEALKTLDQLLREKSAAAAVKAEAMFRMGQIHQTAGALPLAISYLQRTYVSYPRFQPWAAKAYIASAEAFHALGDRSAASNTYREFLDSCPSEDSPDRELAVSRLKTLEEKP
jgi:tetratricopeptide (TPR) repeat protein